MLSQHQAGLDANSGAVAAAAVQAWIRAASQLTPLVGLEGMRALYARSMDLARRIHPWLPPADIATSHAKSLAELRQSLEGREAAEATEAIATVLTNLIELLATMIGKALTNRLFDAAWGPGVPDQDNTGAPK